MSNEVVQVHVHFCAHREPFSAILGTRKIGDFFRVFFTFFRRFEHVELSFSHEFVRDLGPYEGLHIYDGPPGVSEDQCRVAFTAAIAQPVYVRGVRNTVSGVICSRRIFEKAEYTKIALSVSYATAVFMFEFLAGHVGEGFAHELSDTYLRPAPPTFQHWFCAQYIAAALQQGTFLQGLNPSEMTADDLYFRLHLYNTTVLIDDTHAIRLHGIPV